MFLLCLSCNVMNSTAFSFVRHCWSSKLTKTVTFPSLTSQTKVTYFTVCLFRGLRRLPGPPFSSPAFSDVRTTEVICFLCQCIPSMVISGVSSVSTQLCPQHSCLSLPWFPSSTGTLRRRRRGGGGVAIRARRRRRPPAVNYAYTLRSRNTYATPMYNALQALVR